MRESNNNDWTREDEQEGRNLEKEPRPTTWSKCHTATDMHRPSCSLVPARLTRSGIGAPTQGP